MKNTHKPLISVIMPVYNASKYLNESIQSILNQTYKNFEFLIFNDGSTDQSHEIILQYTDSRIRYFHHEQNSGYVKHLNEGIQQAKGEFIARMDADDISLPDRFEKQVKNLLDNPQIALLGGTYNVMDENNQIIKNCPSFISEPIEIKAKLFFYNCFGHPTVMMRKSILKEYQYNTDFIPAEDYLLWWQLAQKHLLSNIPDVVLLYREHSEGISKQKKDKQREAEKKIYRIILEDFGFSKVTDEQLNLHHDMLYYKVKNSYSFTEFINIAKWLVKLYNQNNRTNRFEIQDFKQQLQAYWNNYFAIENSWKRGPKVIPFLWHPLSQNTTKKQKFNFIKRCIIK